MNYNNKMAKLWYGSILSSSKKTKNRNFFSFLKRKKVIKLNHVEYDALIDEKLLKIRKYVKNNFNVRDIDGDEYNYDNEFSKIFQKYQTLLNDESSVTLNSIKLKNKYNKNTLVLSPIDGIYYENRPNIINNARIGIKNMLKSNLIRIIKNRIRLYVVVIKLYFKIREIKKLFPDKRLTTKEAFYLIQASKINKKLLEIDSTKNKKYIRK